MKRKTTATAVDEQAMIEGYLRRKRDLTKRKWSTIESYERTLRYLRTWLDGRSMWDVTVFELMEFCHRPRYARGGGEKVPAPATVRREEVEIRAFYTYVLMASQGQAIFTDPEFSLDIANWEAGKVVLGTPKPIDDDLWDRLHALRMPPFQCDNPVNSDDRLWLGLMYLLGLRKTEVILIPAKAFDLEHGLATFERKGEWDSLHVDFEWRNMLEHDLRPHHSRLRPMIDEFTEVLHEYVERRWDDEFLWPHTAGRMVQREGGRMVKVPTNWDLKSFNKRCWELARQMELPDYKHVFTPHQLRHSAATNLYRCGVPMMRMKMLLNHSSIDTTSGYAKVSPLFTEERKRNMPAGVDVTKE